MNLALRKQCIFGLYFPWWLLCVYDRVDIFEFIIFRHFSPLCSLHAGNTIQHNTRYMYAPKPKVHTQLRNRKEIIFCSSMMLKKGFFVFFSQQTNKHNKNVVGKARGHKLILLAAWLKKYQSQFNLTFSDLSTAAGSIHSALKLTHRLPPQCAEKLH